jgi:hypothetical protein
MIEAVSVGKLEKLHVRLEGKGVGMSRNIYYCNLVMIERKIGWCL